MTTELHGIEDGAGHAGPARVTLVAAGANKRRKWGIAKQSTTTNPDAPAPVSKESQMAENTAPAAAAATPAPAKAAPSLEEILAALKADPKLAEAVMAACSAPGPAAAAAPCAPEDAAKAEIAKASPAVREMLAKAEAEARTAKEAIAKLTAEATAKADAIEEKEAVAKAATDFKRVGGDTAELGRALRAIGKVAPDQAKVIDQRLRAAEAALAAHNLLVAEIGKAGDAKAESAMEKIAKAGAEVKKLRPMLTDEQARMEAVRLNPALHAAFEAERSTLTR